MTRNILFSVIILALLAACKKEFTEHLPITPVTDLAYVKIVHAAPFFRATTGVADTFNVYIGGERANGSPLSYNSIYPVNGTNTYLAVKPGMQEIKLSLPGVSTPDSVNIFSMQQQLDAGKYYTLMITDSIKTAKVDMHRIFVEDALLKPDTSAVGLRFINAVLNDAGTVDVWSQAKNGLVIAGVKGDSASPFMMVTYNRPVADTFYVTQHAPDGTPLGSRTVLAQYYFTTANITTITGGRNYTIYYKGDGTAATGAQGRSMAGYVH